MKNNPLRAEVERACEPDWNGGGQEDLQDGEDFGSRVRDRVKGREACISARVIRAGRANRQAWTPTLPGLQPGAESEGRGF
jgi:hypothetical protein